jgi:fumarate hydratase subunit beta
MKSLELKNPKRLTTPLTEEVIADLRVGDPVLISGELYTARDAAHKRLAQLIAQGTPLPFEPQGQIIYYFGPAPARPGAVIGPGAPTTAERMDAFAPLLMKAGVKGMIGKGKRGPEVRAALKTYRCVYLVAAAGASVLLAKRVVAAETICYEDLGTEAIRRLTVEDFPVLVANDMHGADLYDMARSRYARPSS